MLPPLAIALRDGATHFTGWMSLGEPAVAETLARAGFDSVTLDFQHGLLTVAAMFDCIAGAALAGKPSLVRVPLGDLGLASRALDAAAAGVICPMVDTVEQARAFADVMKFPPRGRRSWGPHRGLALSGRDKPGYLAHANAETLAFAMVETRQALDNLEAIVAVDGIDGVFIGPNDLCVSLTDGATVDPAHDVVVPALDRVLAACRAAGKPAAIYANTPALARIYAEKDFALVAIGSDLGFVAAGGAAALAIASGKS